MSEQEEKPMYQVLEEMYEKGVEQIMPRTERVIRLRPVSAEDLLLEGNIPDILTPLIVKMTYQEALDDDLVDFLVKHNDDRKAALEHLQSVNLVVKKSIADETNIKHLTPEEKRWIFRLVLGPAEILATFRYDQEFDVESLSEGDQVSPAAEPAYEGEEFPSGVDAG